MVISFVLNGDQSEFTHSTLDSFYDILFDKDVDSKNT